MSGNPGIVQCSGTHADSSSAPAFRSAPAAAGVAGRCSSSGEVKFVILRLLKEKPRHGYEVIKALEEKMARLLHPLGRHRLSHAPAAGRRGLHPRGGHRRQEGLHVTPEGERYLEEHKDLLDEILDRVRETVRDFTGGGIGELQGAVRPPGGRHLPAGLAAGPRRSRAEPGRRDPEAGRRRHRARLADRRGGEARDGGIAACTGSSGW